MPPSKHTIGSLLCVAMLFGLSASACSRQPEFDASLMGQIVFNRQPRYEGYFDFKIGSTKVVGEVMRSLPACKEVTTKKLIVRCGRPTSFYANISGGAEPSELIVALVSGPSTVIAIPERQKPDGGATVSDFSLFDYGQATVSVVRVGPSELCGRDYEWQEMPSGRAAHFCVRNVLTLVRSTKKVSDLVLGSRTAKILKKLTEPIFESSA
jgi:hypothetical protein